MKVCVLSSGSKGNSTLIITKNSKILIDLGTNSKYIENSLSKLNISSHEIDAIIITHDHIDHVQGVDVFTSKFSTKVYAHQDLKFKIRNPQFLYNFGKELNINGIIIKSFATSHDASHSVGFVIIDNDKSLCYITDTGYIHRKNYDILSNHDCYVIESNHDVELLMNGKYPFYLKQRILGDKGHLSNKDSIKYLNKFIADKTKLIIFIHLSEENNSIDLLNKEINNLSYKGEILISRQKELTEVINIWLS